MKRTSLILIYSTLIIAVLLVAFPLYMTLIVGFKTPLDNRHSLFAFPPSLYLGNFQTILNNPQYFKSLANTFYITIASIIGSVVLMPAASYALARKMDISPIYRWLYFFILIGIFIPFQVRMIPLIRLADTLNLTNINGIIVLYIAGNAAEAIFLYVGYIRSIPSDLEDAARIDGASTFVTYVRIILPLMKPMIATVIIKDTLLIWNDFVLVLPILNRSPDYWTLTMFQYNFRWRYSADPTIIMTSFIMSMLPVFIIYLFAQKHIIGGLVSGAIKE
jgi:raffinose/stachyose/melibiose transport system permease protein